MRQPLFRSVNYLIVSYVPFVSPLNQESETQWDKKCLEGRNIVYNFADEKAVNRKAILKPFSFCLQD